jgi:hypothetical protein
LEVLNEQVVEGRTIEQHLLDLTPEITRPEDKAAPCPMGDVAATLRHAKLPSFGLDGLAGVRPRKALKIPEGAQFSSRSYVCAAGSPGMPGCGLRKSRRTADNGPRIRTIVFHGDADRIVHPSNAARIVEAQARIGVRVERVKATSSARRAYSCTVTRDKTGSAVLEQWLIHGSGHAWSGGSPDGTFTDPYGPDASREMLRFFRQELPRSRGV